MPSSPRHPATDGRADYLLVDYGSIDREPWDFSQALAAALSFAGSLLSGRNFAIAFTAAISFSGSVARGASKVFAASVSPSGAISRATAKGLAATLSFGGAQTKLLSRALSGTLSFGGSLSTQLSKFLQQQLLTRVKTIVSAMRLNEPATALRTHSILTKVIGPDEMAFKRGTDIEFETTFTDADGVLYDPNTNTVKVQVKKPDGTVYTGWSFADNKYMTRQSTGVYRVILQTAASDPVGTWTVEVQGSVGAYTSMDDFKFSLKA